MPVLILQKQSLINLPDPKPVAKRQIKVRCNGSVNIGHENAIQNVSA
jgi:hypothetical protein